MAQPGQTTIQLYSTTTTATTPSPSNLVSGELALNLTDKKIFSKDGSGTVVEMSMSPLNPSYTGTLTGGTGVVNLGSGQFVKDASGNVGVGAVPSAVAATTNTLQFEYGSGVTSATGGDLNINNNAYNSASNVWKYHTSGLGASRYQQDFGAHKWHTAPSGTAGNPISFTQAMTLDASGNLGLGVAPSGWGGGSKGVELAGGGVLESCGAIGFAFGANYYNNGSSDINKAGGWAGKMEVGSGFTWKGAAGAAGNATALTTLMTLSAGADLEVAGQIFANGRGITKGFVTPDWRMYNTAGNALVWNNGSDRLWLTPVGNVTPGVDNTQTMGSASYRWSQVYAGTGTINTSDAREKTPVRSLFDDELQAAIALSKEVGVYQFLDSVKAKSDKARHHIGMTVQRAIEIMEHHGIDPFAYGFICYDKWGEETKEHPAIEAREAVEAKAAVLDDEGNVIEPAVEAQPAIKAKDAWTEVTLKAGDRYSFRYDQLTLFIARGIDARLAALEAA